MMIQAKLACWVVGLLSAVCLCAAVVIHLSKGALLPGGAFQRRASHPSVYSGEGALALPEAIPVHLTSEMAQRLGSEESTAVEDLAAVHEMIRFYAMEMRRSLLLGTNQEITRGLLWQDDLGRAMLSSDHPSINARGQLVDRWRTPFFIHAQSHIEVEVLSAGPDKKFYTEDDLIWPEPVERGPEAEYVLGNI